MWLWNSAERSGYQLEWIHMEARTKTADSMTDSFDNVPHLRESVFIDLHWKRHKSSCNISSKDKQCFVQVYHPIHPLKSQKIGKTNVMRVKKKTLSWMHTLLQNLNPDVRHQCQAKTNTGSQNLEAVHIIYNQKETETWTGHLNYFSHIICFLREQDQTSPRAWWEGTQIIWRPKPCRQSTQQQTQTWGASSDRMRLRVGDFQDLPFLPLKARHNEMLYIANKTHMFFRLQAEIKLSAYVLNETKFCLYSVVWKNKNAPIKLILKMFIGHTCMDQS